MPATFLPTAHISQQLLHQSSLVGSNSTSFGIHSHPLPSSCPSAAMEGFLGAA